MQIQYTRSAMADLVNLRAYYGELSEQALQNTVADILETIEALPTSISKGRITEIPNVWEKLSRKYKYLIPYYVDKDVIWILRIYDTRQKGFSVVDIISNPQEFK